MTYVGAAERLGVSAEAIRAIAKRRNWPRRRSNTDPHGAVEVQMPDDVQITPKRPADLGAHPITTRSPPGQSDVAAGALAALETAVTSLTARAEAAEQRAATAEQGRETALARADDLRAQVALLNTELTVAQRFAEQSAREAQEAAQAADALRQAEAARQALGRWARLRAAWRGR